jgi:tetratricopeptide (TPR) repeat protein
MHGPIREAGAMSRSSIVCFFVAILLIPTFATLAYPQRDNDPLSPGSSFEISGQIRSADNKTIENILVRLETSSGALVDQGATDSNGRFRFARLRPGQYRVSAKALGLIAAPQSVDVNRASPRIYVMLQLNPEAATFRSRETARPGTIDASVPVQAAAALQKGKDALAEKKPNEAIAHVQKAISIHPDFFQAQLLLGTIYMDEKEWTKAEDALRRALKIDPKAVIAMVSLGEVYRRQKKYEEAQKLLEEVLKIDNSSWEGHYTLGRVHWELKDITKAGLHIARTLELQPNLAEAHLLAGNIFIRSGLPQNALLEYEEYLRLSPQGEFAGQAKALVDKLKKSLPAK